MLQHLKICVIQAPNTMVCFFFPPEICYYRYFSVQEPTHHKKGKMNHWTNVGLTTGIVLPWWSKLIIIRSHETYWNNWSLNTRTLLSIKKYSLLFVQDLGGKHSRKWNNKVFSQEWHFLKWLQSKKSCSLRRAAPHRLLKSPFSFSKIFLQTSSCCWPV